MKNMKRVVRNTALGIPAVGLLASLCLVPRLFPEQSVSAVKKGSTQQETVTPKAEKTSNPEQKQASFSVKLGENTKTIPKTGDANTDAKALINLLKEQGKEGHKEGASARFTAMISGDEKFMICGMSLDEFEVNIAKVLNEHQFKDGTNIEII
jgi:hypothetical protein